MDIVWTLIIILFVLWLLGFGFAIAGGLVHILIVVAVILLIFKLIDRGRI